MALNKDSRSLNASRNASFAIINKVFMMVLAFITRKFFIYYIGIEYLGINGLFSNILSLLSMADLGIGTAMNVSLYKPIAENDKKKLSDLLKYFKKIYFFITVGVTVLGIALLPFLDYIVNMEYNIPHLRVYYILFVLKNTVSYLFVYKSAIIRADQNNYIINIIDIVVNISKSIFQILVVVFLKKFLLYIILEVVAVLIHNIVVSHVANSKYEFINGGEEIEKEEKKKIFNDVWSIFLYKISSSIINGTDNILISIICGTIKVGLYSNYYMVATSLENCLNLLFSSLTASIGNLMATTSNMKTRYKTFKLIQMIAYWTGGTLVLGLLFLLQDFICIWVGNSYQLDYFVVISVSLWVFMTTTLRPIWVFREGTGMYTQIRFIELIAAGLNIVFSIIFGKALGVGGIIFATSLARLFTSFWYEPSLLFKYFFSQNLYKYFIDYFKNIMVIMLAFFLCCFLTPFQHIENVTILMWLIKAFIVVIITTIVYLVRYYRTEEFALLKSKIINIIKK